MPPTRDQEGHSEAKIVSELGKEFNIDEVYSSESSFIGSLKTVDDFRTVEVPPSCPLNFDEAMLEVCDLPSIFSRTYNVLVYRAYGHYSVYASLLECFLNVQSN